MAIILLCQECVDLGTTLNAPKAVSDKH